MLLWWCTFETLVILNQVPSEGTGERPYLMGNGERRILVIGHSTPLVEGVYDLLQLVGYQVAMSTSWTETEHTMQITPPNLVIVDLSDSDSETYHLSEQIRNMPRWSNVPLLFISFSGDDRIRELQGRSQNYDGRLHYYAHTLLGMDGLLDKVQACLS
jgi:PleD family two-component response regulator